VVFAKKVLTNSDSGLLTKLLCAASTAEDVAQEKIQLQSPTLTLQPSHGLQSK
jgi:hypothetical protein